MTVSEAGLLADRYALQQVIGRGGMSTVHKAIDTVLDREVAIKVFRSDALDPAHRQRQLAEVRLLARLSHPNLVTVFDAHLGEELETSFLVMELIDGPTLSGVLAEEGRLGTDRVVALALALADGLSVVHAAGIVHRDLKPANVLLAGETVPKLVDFGIAWLMDATRHTGVGLTIGTAAYLSPEQVSGRPLGTASDIYSLGLVLLECLTGTPAYVGTGVEVALARLSRPPYIPSGLHPDLELLLSEMVATEPSARPVAAQVAARLRVLPSGPPSVPVARAPEQPTARMPMPTVVAPAATPTPAVREPLAPLPRRGHGLTVALALLIVAALAAIVVVVAVVAQSGGGSGLGPVANVPSPTAPAGPGQLQHDIDTLGKVVSP